MNRNQQETGRSWSNWDVSQDQQDQRWARSAPSQQGAAGGGSAALAVSLADVAQPGGAVQVVEPPVVVDVSAVLVSRSHAVTGPTVGLAGFPSPGQQRHKHQIYIQQI